MSLGTTHLGFPTDYQAFIYMSRYSRYLWNEGRREYWGETVKRYLDFFQVHLGETCGYSLTKDLRSEIEEAILQAAKEVSSTLIPLLKLQPIIFLS